MKTIYPIRKLSIYFISGLAAFSTFSCGSYQNSTTDRDGIYGDSDRQRENQNVGTQNQYKDYFGSLQDDQIFTDVESYSTTSEAEPQNSEGYSSGYAGWGNESDNVTVNVYGNNWGYNHWNSYWYGPGYNYYNPYWGMSWGAWYGPSYGWYNNYYPYYGYYGNGWYNGYHPQSYVYHRGHRNASYNNGIRGGNASRSYAQGPRSTNLNAGRRSAVYTGTRSYTTPTRSNINNQPSTPRTNTYSTPRSNSSNNTVRPSSSPTRSYTPSSNSGGGRSGGSYGGGGGRSGGGGRR